MGALPEEELCLETDSYPTFQTSLWVLYFLHGFIKGYCEIEGRVPSKIDKMLHYLNDKSPFYSEVIWIELYIYIF